MKAVVWTDYGIIAVQNMAEPQPAPQEILVRVQAAALCKTDIGMIQHGILDIKPPVIIGHEVAGVVEGHGRRRYRGCKSVSSWRSIRRFLAGNVACAGPDYVTSAPTQSTSAPTHPAAWPSLSRLTTAMHIPFRPSCHRLLHLWPNRSRMGLKRSAGQGACAAKPYASSATVRSDSLSADWRKSNRPLR